MIMSTELLVAGEHEQSRLTQKEPRASSLGFLGRVQKLWCAPMSDVGEWVITWTSVPRAVSYELQSSLDGSDWEAASKFSGTRAVLLIGPALYCWVRVRAVGPGGPG